MLLRGVGIPLGAAEATIILGAGASRGASFLRMQPGQALRPLDADFFRTGQRLDQETFRGPVRDVIEFVREEYGATKLPTLETVFTQLQGFDHYLQQIPAAGSGPRSPRYKTDLGNLLNSYRSYFVLVCVSTPCMATIGSQTRCARGIDHQL